MTTRVFVFQKYRFISACFDFTLRKISFHLHLFCEIALFSVFLFSCPLHAATNDDSIIILVLWHRSKHVEPAILHAVRFDLWGQWPALIFFGILRNIVCSECTLHTVPVNWELYFSTHLFLIYSFKSIAINCICFVNGIMWNKKSSSFKERSKSEKKKNTRNMTAVKSRA